MTTIPLMSTQPDATLVLNHAAPNHAPCYRTRCVLCCQQVRCDTYFINDHACDSCADRHATLPQEVTVFAVAAREYRR